MSTAELLTKLLDRKVRLYLVATGAGAGIQNELWRVPGCSFFLVGSSFPYAPEQSAGFAGIRPEKYASEDFALDLAAAAYVRLDLEKDEEEPVALAVTASVASVKQHRGEHRAFIVCMTRTQIIGMHVVLDKGVGAEQRIADGNTVDQDALHVLLVAMGLKEGHACDSLEEKARERFFKNPLFSVTGERWPDDHTSLDPCFPLFPGAFNPPHEGHEAIADEVEEFGEVGEPIFTICSTPPHKSPLTVQEMLRRQKMLWHRNVLFTQNDPLFIDKARARPGTPFILGADTLLRMADPKWGPDPKAMFQEFMSLGTKFFVFGREINGTFVSAADAIGMAYSMTGETLSIFHAIEGRWDVSSTDLRQSPSPHTQSAEDVPTHSASP